MKQFDPNNINGVIPAMITSFNKDESINKEGIRKTVNYLIAEKVDGLYVTGSTGETFLMSQEEKKRAIEVIVEEVNGRVPVIAHIGSIGTKITTELGMHAEKVGVDALSALPPFYYGFTNEEIFNYYSKDDEEDSLPDELNMNLYKKNTLRYGENPHQAGAFYLNKNINETVWTQHQGKALSYNNYNDLESAFSIVNEFSEPACAIVKHANPCGFGIGNDLETSYESAVSTAPVSYFGGIVGFNGVVDKALAEKLIKPFLECVIALCFSDTSL